MTILIHFHQSHYRYFKAYYTRHVWKHMRAEFPGLVCYSRFVELMPSVLLPLFFYLLSQRGQITGIAFIGSTPILVCHTKRIRTHRVFADYTERGNSSMGWFYGFRLHLVVNDQGELLTFQLSCRAT